MNFLLFFPKINPSLSEDTCEEGWASVVGKNGAQYKKHGAFCLETQKYADAVHHVNIFILLNLHVEQIFSQTFSFSSNRKHE